MPITIEGMGQYFRNHAKCTLLPQYSVEQQTGAIEQAKRDLSRELGRPMDENEPPFQYGEQRRDEYAVYEQALHALEQIGVGNGSGSDVPVLTGSSEAQPDKAKDHPKFCPEALRWFGIRAGVIVIRG